jgi:DNA-binding CsgD family transcriptional regulator/tetratricopeptide (TPR) repeat protein
VGSDEEVALELEAAAARARSQGAVAVAVSALERAAGLTGNESLRGERYLRAAELALELGQSQVVSRLMERVDGTTLTEKENARLTWLKATTSPEGTGNRLLLSRLIDAAHGMQTAGETALALQLLTAAALRCYYGDPGDDTRDEVVAVLESLGLDDLDSQLILALAFANPIEKCGELLLRLDRLGEVELQDAQVLYNLGTAASLLSAFNVASRFLAPASEAVRAQGRLGFLPAVLHCVAWAETHSGNWSVALPAAEETQAIGFEMGQPLFALGALELQVQQAAYRGNPESVTEVIASLKLHLSSTSSVALASITQLSLGLLALSNGDYEDAFTQIRRMFEPGDLVFHFMRCWAIGELAEAAVACGRVDEARACLRDLEAYTKGSPLPWLQAGLAYARPLLAEDAEAEDLYRQSMEADLTRWPFYRGRIMLAYGSWLRRHRRVAESRALLRGARDVLDAAGTVPWANRARSELRAAGESSPNRITATGERLTPQELQIAQLAGRGLSNREIGRQLFLSHRTVGSHLYRIFPKLGITSRWELREVLRE